MSAALALVEQLRQDGTVQVLLPQQGQQFVPPGQVYQQPTSSQRNFSNVTGPQGSYANQPNGTYPSTSANAVVLPRSQHEVQQVPMTNLYSVQNVRPMPQAMAVTSRTNAVQDSIPYSNNIALNSCPKEIFMEDQNKCPELAPGIQLLACKGTGLKRPVNHDQSWICDRCDMTNGVLTFRARDGIRWVAPKSWRKILLELAHQSEGRHYAPKHMMNRLKKYAWRDMALDVDNYADECENCRAQA